MQSQPFKYRYPGLQPFGKAESPLFFGREAETEELFSLVSLEKVVVLFGKSGLGKSSLLNAGLSPRLEENGYMPVRIRFNATYPATANNPLLQDCIASFNGEANKEAILYNRQEPQLWEYIKAARFENAAGEAQVPVFMFDQFEEFFYQPLHWQQAFLKQLAEVAHEQQPRRILEWITGIEPQQRTAEQIQWHKQPPVRIIFSLRSDKLALMQQLVPFIPTVLRNRYELKPLNRQQAADAIRQPAAKELGDNYTPPFTFSDAVLNSIVNELGKGSNEIESSQLQMVCNYIESKVKGTNPQGVTEVTAAIINPARDIPKIRDNFYEDQVAKIADEKDRQLVKTVIEDDMVIDGQRASLLEKQLLLKLGGKKELVDLLLQSRLIREENTNRGLTYEVSHDTLVETIEKSKWKRHATEDELRKEEERIKLAEERVQLEKEAKEKEQQLKTETELRLKAQTQQQEADKQKMVAEGQREEAQRQRASAIQQRKRAAKYFFIAAILGVVSLGFLIYYIYDAGKQYKEKKEIERVKNNIEEQKQKLDQQKDDLDRFRNTTINFVKGLLEDERWARNYYSKNENVTLCLQILQQAKKIDAFNNDPENLSVIDGLIATLYEKTMYGENSIDTMRPVSDTTAVKQIEYLEKVLPRINEKSVQEKYPQNADKPAKGLNRRRTDRLPYINQPIIKDTINIKQQ